MHGLVAAITVRRAGRIRKSSGRGRVDRLEPYGLIIVMGLLAIGLLGQVIAPVVAAVTRVIFSLVGG